jgi:RNA polymerase sigma factor (sigma-70 family)
MTAGSGNAAQRSFSATRWSMVLAAAGGAQDALGALCSAYWYPLYAFIRRQGVAPHDAEDLTQGFFQHLLAKGAIARVALDKGRFRTFLLASLKNFLADERDRARALKRGGGRAEISFDACEAEARYAIEPRDELTPDRLFDRRWALAVIDRALGRLRDEFAAYGKGTFFDALRPLLTGAGAGASLAELGERFSMSEGAVKVAAHRLRQRYGAALRAEIAETVGTASEVDAELRHLLEALG